MIKLGLKKKKGKICSIQMEARSQQEKTIFISEKAEYKQNFSEEKKWTLDTDKGNNSTRGCNNYKYIHTKYWYTPIS
jgi:hypothetical protein